MPPKIKSTVHIEAVPHAAQGHPFKFALEGSLQNSGASLAQDLFYLCLGGAGLVAAGLFVLLPCLAWFS